METYLRKIAVLVVVILVTSGFAVAGNVRDDEGRNTVDVQAIKAELAQKEAQMAAEMAQKRAEAAQRQAEIARVARVKATPRTPEPAAPLNSPPRRPVEISSSRNISPWWSAKSARTDRVLVIPAAEIKTKDIVAMTEDMSVMSRIFEKNLQRAHIIPAGGDIFVTRENVLSTFLSPDKHATQSMYLQGYGALFLMKVDFPLSPPPQVQKEEEAKEQDTDPVWEQMKRQMYEPEEARTRTARTAREPEEKYDAEKAADFKTTLITSLKHAANIRNLKPDESVVLTVTGGGGRATLVGDATSAKTKIFVVGSDGDTKIIREPVSADAGGLSPTILVIRAKKSDIDGFAKGDLDLDQFREKTQMLTCPYLGYLGDASKRGDPFGYYYYEMYR